VTLFIQRMTFEPRAIRPSRRGTYDREGRHFYNSPVSSMLQTQSGGQLTNFRRKSSTAAAASARMVPPACPCMAMLQMSYRFKIPQM